MTNPLPLLTWGECEHRQVEVLRAGLLHCRACSTFWSQPHDVIVGDIGEREWVEVSDPATGDVLGSVALHASTAKLVQYPSGEVLWERLS